MEVTRKKRTNYRRYTVSGYNVELIKRPGYPTYWQYKVWEKYSDISDRLVESGWVSSRDKAATAADMVIADHRDKQG